MCVVIAGKSFGLSLIINTMPAIIANLVKAIKITVDGPREPRNKSRKYTSTLLYKLSCLSRYLGDNNHWYPLLFSYILHY